MKKYKLEIIIFTVNIVYMILELVASRILSPYFGSGYLIWTSVIGIILLSTSIGNYIGGKIADKEKTERWMRVIIIISALFIMAIPITQQNIINTIISIINKINIGAIIATTVIFFIPSMLIGMLSPIIIKLKIKNLKDAGQLSGKIYAIATLGSIIGTFLGGFYLIPNFGCNEILFLISILMIAILIFSYDFDEIKEKKKIIGICIFIIITSSFLFYAYSNNNKTQSENVSKNEENAVVSYDTQYGRALITNKKNKDDLCRYLLIDKGNESATYTDENKCYELVFEYTKYYDFMYKSSNNIKDVLMIGGAGYSYPKYFISHYSDKNMDVVEIDGKVTEIAKEYFYLNKLIDEFDLNNNKRLNLIEQDGRIYLNKNNKKYDAILNDAFLGVNPAKTLTTIEAIQKIHNSLTKNGIYLTNIISSIEGEDSKFIKAEINTIKKVFNNVYIVPCRNKNEKNITQNMMVIATDEDLNINENVNINYSNSMVLTDDYCPVENLVPRM